MVRLFVTEELAACPECGAPPIKTGDRSRQCNTCGLVWDRLTEKDELDLEADQVVRSRAFNEKGGGARSIPPGQTRW